eukprot:CAMPEP_0119150438 /NCGR_PEP_ID=MMETSP1310-20130426/44793_1 /TAXON_ID=464262 /ORGANISM="Genus nov. species nov., Strain RCC2339" /LENGTH=326 /DNA_ID=CAMNT_0007142633 /DNA_START=210 /DNA_END=1190 /DNA_ORIENTATION=+
MASGSNKIICTHSGNFHCDEALACFMLDNTNEFRGARIVRSRDADDWAKADIVVDVGGEYDPSRHRYDHHQKSFNGTLDDEHDIKLSSAGLVYKHMGREVVRNLTGEEDKDVVEKLYYKMYESLVASVDAIDNGVDQYEDGGRRRYAIKTDLASRVGRLNPEWNEEAPDYDGSFAQAVKLTGAEFSDILGYLHKSWWPARALARAAMAPDRLLGPGKNILRLDRSFPWKAHLLELEEETGTVGHHMYVLYPDQQGKYRIQAVPAEADSFQNRKPLPAAWRGLRFEELSKISGIPGGVFVHASGFIGGNETFDGALAMAIKSLSLSE